MSDYGYSNWSQDAKHEDKAVLDAFFASQTDWDKVMGLPEVENIFAKLDEKLFKHTQLSTTDLNLVASIDLLRGLARALQGNDNDGAALRHAVKVTDGLLKSVWWMTNQIGPSSKDERRMLLLRVRKALGSLL